MEKQCLQSFPRWWREEWPVRRTLLFCGLIGYGITLASIRLPPWCAVLPVFPLLLCLLLPRLRRPHLLLECGVALLCWMASAGFQAAYVAPRQALDGQSDTLSGWVEAAYNNHFYTIRVTDAEKVPAGSRVLLYCPDVCAPSLYEAVTADVTLTAIRRDRSSLLADGILLQAFPANDGENSVTIHGKAADLPLLTRIQMLRQNLSRVLRQHLPGDEGAMLTALCLGERQALPHSIQSAFRESGLAHVLVVSGLHLSMVVLAVEALLRKCRLSKRLASLFTIPALLAFVLLIGLTPSVVRAGVMCLLWLCGRLIRRRASGLNSLGLAAPVLLVNNPFVAADIGFLLSFAATAGVLCLLPRLLQRSSDGYEPHFWVRMRNRLLHKTNSLLAASVCATLFLIPLLCYYFGGFPLITPVSNLLAVPAATYAMLAGWVGTLLCCVPTVGFLGKPLLLCAGLAARLAARLAEWCSRFSGWVAVTEMWKLGAVCGCCVLLIAWLILRPQRSWKRAPVACAVLIVLACGATVLTRAVPVVRVTRAGNGAAVLVQSGGHTELLVTRSDGFADALQWLTADGCTRLDTLIVEQSDPAYAGGLCRLLRQIPTARVLCTDGAEWLIGTPVATEVLTAPSQLTHTALWTRTGPEAWQVTANGRTYHLNAAAESESPE